MTALTTYKVAYKVLRAAWNGCHLRELLHPANQDWAQGLIRQLARSALRKSKQNILPVHLAERNEFHAIGNGTNCRIVVKRIQGISFAEPHCLRHHSKHQSGN